MRATDPVTTQYNDGGDGQEKKEVLIHENNYQPASMG
jgi:hypothetical protein